MTKFLKPAISLDEQLELLQARGLIINDREKARHYLQYIGYYRLSAYMRPFQEKEEHKFKPETHFEAILDVYIFR